MSSQARISAKHGGENAEAAVIQTVSEIEHLTDIEDVHADARATTVIVPDDQLPTVALPVVEIGTLIEIKSVMVVYGEGQTRGRYYLRKQQHQHLLENGAIYLFAVCAPMPDRPILALKLVPATVVTDLVSSWIDAGDRANYAQIAWSRIFDPAEVERNRGGSV